MNEYISREALIEMVNGRERPENERIDIGYNEALNDIKQLLVNDIKQRLVEMPATDAQPINQWISCKDKMPEEYKTVLVYEKDYGVMIGELEKKFFDTQYFIARKSGLILRTTEVTHWQPLPEPPNE